jgi:hypothetical protein
MDRRSVRFCSAEELFELSDFFLDVAIRKWAIGRLGDWASGRLATDADFAQSPNRLIA